MSQPNLIQNPIKLSKFKNNNRATQLKRNKLVSFWAFVFSLIMYISIFYMFNLSPYNLVSTTNFWFFISNTLILIIAVDFNFGSSFSSSSNDQEYSFQEHYMKIYQEKSTINSTLSCNYPPYTIEKKETIIPHEEEESIKDVHLVENNKQQEDEDEEEESIKDVLVVENNKQVQDEDDEEEEVINIIDHKNEMKSGETKFYRSNSELKAIIPMEKNMKKIQRSQSERYDLQVSGDHEEINDEFSEMSVEELNRRVEDFIQRFNRQIRLQAAARNNYLQT